MADAVDTRIVEMQFQNKDFEKNIATSQKSLERFKKELNFDETSKGMEDFSKSMKTLDFSTLETNVQKLTDKFTGLGNAGEFVLSRIRRTLEGLGDQVIAFANSLTTVQTKAGFVKYESLNKSVQTLRSATNKEEKEIYSVLDRLTKYTDQTSYDFAQGVTSISQLVSSGAATLDQAETVVEGFYNYAAKAGADTQKAAHALEYSMVQALQRGFLDWGNAKELNRQSLLTMDFKEQLLETAVALGTVTKEGNKYFAISKKNKKQKKVEINTTNLFNDSLQHQWATTKVINATLEKYADTTTEFGEQAYAAAQRCTTFTDALNAWKDMLSTGWMTTYRTVFGDLSEAMSLFSAICEKVSIALDGLLTTRNKILNAWKEMGGRDSLMGALFGELEDPDGNVLFEGAYGILDILTKIGDMISDGWWNMVMNLIPKNEQDILVQEVNKNIDLINQALEQQGQGDLKITKPFESFAELWNSEFAKGTGLREGAFGGGLQAATKQVQGFVERIREWFNTVDEQSGTTRLQKIQAVLDAVINTLAFGFDIIGGIVDFIGMIFHQLEPSFDAIGRFFEALAGGVEEGEQSIRNSGGITRFFTNLAEILRPITGVINAVVEGLANLMTALVKGDDAGEGVRTVWDQIAGVIKKVWGVLKAVGKPIVDFIGNVLDSISAVIESGFSAESIEKFKNGIATAFNNMISSLSEVIWPMIEKAKLLIQTIYQTVKEEISKYFNDENSLGHKIVSWFTGIFDTIKKWLDKTFPGLSDSITGFFSRENLTERFGKFGEGLSGVIEWFKTFFGGLSPEVKTVIGLGGGAIGAILGLTGLVKRFSRSSDDLSGAFNGAGSPSKFGKRLLILSGSIAGLKVVLDKVFPDVSTKVNEYIASFWDKIVNWFKSDNKWDGLKDLGASISTWFSNQFGGNNQEKKGIAEKIGEIVKKLIHSLIGKDAQKDIQKESEKATNEQKSSSSILDLVKSQLVGPGSFGEGIKKALAWIDNFLKDFNSETLAIIIGIGIAVVAVFKLAKSIKSIGKGITKVADAIKGTFKLKLTTPTDFSTKMLTLAGAIAILGAVAYALAKLELSQGIQGVAGVVILMIALGTMFGIMKRVARGMTVRDSLKLFIGLYGIAIAVGRLLNALTPLASVAPDELEKMGYGLLGITLAMMAIMTAASIGDFKWSSGAGFLILAYSIGVLINSLKQIMQFRDEAGNWDFDAIKAIAITFGAIMLAFIALAAVSRKSGASLLGLAGVAASIGIILFALKGVANIGGKGEWEGLAKMLAVFGGIMVGLTVFVWLVQRMKNKGTLKDSDLWQLVGLAAGVTALIFALKSVADMQWPQLGKMGAVFGGVVAGLSMLIWVINKTSKASNERGLKSAGFLWNMIALAGGIIALILVLKSVANMEWQQIGKMGAVFGGIVLGLSGLIAVMNLTSKGKDERGLQGSGFLWNMIALAGGLIALIEVLKPLTEMEWGDLGKMGAVWAGVIAGLAVMIGMISHLMKRMTEIGNAKHGGNAVAALALVGLIIGAICATFVLTKDADWKQMAAVAAGMVFVLFAMGYLLKKAKSLGQLTKNGKKALAALGMLALIIAAYGAILVLTKDGDWKQTAAVAVGIAALALVMLAMAKAIKMINGVDLVSGIKSIALLAIGIAAITGVLGALAPWIGSQVGDGIANVMAGLSRASTSISNFARTMGGVSGLDSAKQKIEVLIATIKELNGMRGYTDDIEAFANGVFLIGVGMGMFTSAVSEIGDPEESNGFKAMNKLLGMKDDLKAFGSEISGLLIGAKFANLGSGLEMFDQETGKMPDPENSNAFKTITALAGMAESLKTINTTATTSLSTKIADLGSAMKLYAQGADALKPEDISDEGVRKAATLMERMAAIISEDIAKGDFEFVLPNLPEVGDENTPNTLSYFGVQLVTLAQGLSNYVDACKGIGLNAFKGLLVLDFLAGIRGRLKNQDASVIPTFSDDQGNVLDEGGLSKFGTELTTLATGLANFVKASSEIGNIQDGIDALTKFMELKDALAEKQEEILKFVMQYNQQAGEINAQVANAGDSDIRDLEGFNEQTEYITDDDVDEFKQFGLHIGSLGDALKYFAGQVNFGEAEADKFNDALLALEKLVEMRVKLPNVGGIAQWFSGNQESFTKLAEGIEALGGGLAKFQIALTSDGLEYDYEFVNNALTSIETMVRLTNLLYKPIEDLAGGVGGEIAPNRIHFATKMLGDLQNLLLVMSGVTNNIPGAENLGDDYQGIAGPLAGFFNQFAAALNSGDLQAGVDASTILTNVAMAIRDLVSVAKEANEEYGIDFSIIGEQICAGIVVGIQNGTSKVTAAAEKMAQEAYDAAKAKLVVNSPSKVFAELGESTGEGMTLGMDNSQSDVEKSGSDLADSAIDGTEKTYREKLDNLVSFMQGIIHKDKEEILPMLFEHLFGSPDDASKEQMRKIESSSYYQDFMNELSQLTPMRRKAALEELKKLQEEPVQLPTESFFVDGTEAQKEIEAGVDQMEKYNKYKSEVFGKLLVKAIKPKRGSTWLIEEIGNNLKGDFEAVGSVVDTINDGISTVHDKVVNNPDMVQAIWQAIYMAADAMDDAGGDWKKAVLGFGNSLLREPETLKTLTKDTALQKPVEIITGTTEWVTSAVNTVSSELQEDGANWSTALRSLAQKFVETPELLEMAEKNSKLASLIGWVNKAKDTFIPAVETAISTFEQTGGNWKASLITLIGNLMGDEDVRSSVMANLGFDGITSMIETLRQTASDFFDSDTGSKVIAWLNNAANASGAFMNGESSGKLKSVVSTLTTMLDEDIDTNPTITPILDLSNFSTGIDFIDEQLGLKRTVELSSNGNQYAQDSIPRNDSGTNGYKTPDLSEILSGIATLGTKIAGVAQAVSNMQIILDTGGLVGAVTDGVNKNLGSKTTYQRRRN